MYQNTWLLALLVLVISACRREVEPAGRAMYYWRTALSLRPAERALLDSLGVERLYVKYFDVDIDAGGEPLPLAQLEADTALLQDIEIIPAVFITNRTLERCSSDQLDTLAVRMYKKIKELHAPLSRWPITEIQIDCDWTEGTRESYFYLLKKLRAQLVPGNCALSATIRLHQVRYFKKTGIPPVDRGMLMFYNMGDVENWDEPNSILNIKKGEPYLKGASRYPLPLDVALPAFGWGVLYREGRMIRLIYPIDEKALADTSRFSVVGPQRWEVIKSTYLDGNYLYKGDRIRVETAAPGDMRQAAELLQRSLRRDPRTVALYHLDSLLIKRYTHVQLDSSLQIMAPR